MSESPALHENLKNFRTRAGLSLNDVAQITGVSKTMLSQIERGESVPTIATVWKIANGLKIKFDTLLGKEAFDTEVKSVSGLPSLTDNEHLIDIYCMFPFTPMRGFELFYGILRPGCNYLTEGHLNSVSEYLTVTQGTVTLEANGNTYTVPAGSAISFDCQKGHSYSNCGTEVAQALFLVCYD